jgi:hypothetical protein
VAGVVVPAASLAPAAVPRPRVPAAPLQPPPVPGDFEIIDPPEPPPAIQRPRESSSPALVDWAGIAISVVLSVLIFREIPTAESEPDDGSAEFARRRAMDSFVVTILGALFAYGFFRMSRTVGMIMMLPFLIAAGAAVVSPFVTLWYGILWLARR